jgi:hypothetical protein
MMPSGIVPKIYNRIADSLAYRQADLLGVFSLMRSDRCIGMVFFFTKKREMEDEESDVQRLLCRFVMDGMGRKVGESIAVDEDILILKSGATFLGIPLKHIEEEEKTLLVKGLIDREKARMMGEQWRQETFQKGAASEEE